MSLEIVPHCAKSMPAIKGREGGLRGAVITDGGRRLSRQGKESGLTVI